MYLIFNLITEFQENFLFFLNSFQWRPNFLFKKLSKENLGERFKV